MSSNFPPPLRADELDAAIRERYATTTGASLAAELGLSLRSLYCRAHNLGVKRARSDRHTPARQALQDAARHRDGVRAADVARQLGMPLARVSDTASRLVRAGLLFRVEISYRNVRYCASQAAADALTARLRSSGKAATANRSTVIVTHSRGPAHLPGDPVITSATVFTYAPAPRQALRSNTFLFFA